MKLLATLIFGGITFGSLLAWDVMAGDGGGCCARCGCANLVPVCRQVPVITKVPRVEYSCKCGEICVPGRSVCCGQERVTDGDGNCRYQKVYQPTYGKIYPTVTLVRTTRMVEICTYRCVVEYVCSQCGCNCEGRTGRAGPIGPAAPVIQPRIEPHPLLRQSS